MLKRAVWVGVFAAVAAPGCMTHRDRDAIWAEIAAVRRQGAEVLRSLGEGRADLASMAKGFESRLGETDARIRAAESLLRRSNADFYEQLQRLQIELSRVSGRLDHAERNTEVLKRDLDGFREQVGHELAKRPAAPGTAQAPSSPAATMQAASKALASGRYAEAVKLFTRLKARSPQHPRIVDIRFALAEAYAGNRQYKEAIGEYYELYPLLGRTSRAAEVLIRIARVYARAGDEKTAALALRVLMKNFRGSGLVQAMKRLARALLKPE
jgi:TolA-binding protein